MRCVELKSLRTFVNQNKSNEASKRASTLRTKPWNKLKLRKKSNKKAKRRLKKKTQRKKSQTQRSQQKLKQIKMGILNQRWKKAFQKKLKKTNSSKIKKRHSSRTSIDFTQRKIQRKKSRLFETTSHRNVIGYWPIQIQRSSFKKSQPSIRFSY